MTDRLQSGQRLLCEYVNRVPHVPESLGKWHKLNPVEVMRLHEMKLSDVRIAKKLGGSHGGVRHVRERLGLKPNYKFGGAVA